MSYITQLESEISSRIIASRNIQSVLTELVSYLHSDKFSSPGDLENYVNRNDILPRLELVFDILRTQSNPRESVIGKELGKYHF